MCSREISIFSLLRIINHPTWRFPGSKMPSLGPEVDVDRLAAHFLCPRGQAGGPSFCPLGGAREKASALPCGGDCSGSASGQVAKVTNLDARGTLVLPRRGCGEERYFNLPDALELQIFPLLSTSGLPHALCLLSLNQHLFSSHCLDFPSCQCVLDTVGVQNDRKERRGHGVREDDLAISGNVNLLLSHKGL